MKIVYKKECDINTVLYLFSKFIKEHAEDYPVFKDDMVIEVLLKNSIGQINPDNERVFTFGQKEINALLENEQDRETEYVFTYRWEDFVSDHSDIIKKQIEKEKKSLTEAKEKGMRISAINKRENKLKRSERMLQYEQDRLIKLQPYLELFQKGEVEFKYIYEPYNGEVDKRVFFEIDGKKYFFTYYYGTREVAGIRGKNCICDESGNEILCWYTEWNNGSWNDKWGNDKLKW